MAFSLGRGAGSGWDLEGEVRAASASISRDSPVVLDVGANDGRWTLALLARMGPRAGRILAVECAPRCLPPLREATAPHPQVTIIPEAVSDREGVVTLHTPSVGSGLSSLHSRADTSIRSHRYETVPVRARTLDNLCREHGVDRIDFLKMDVEGHELAVLHGATELLARRAIHALSFEFGSANTNSRTYFLDFWSTLVPLGYRISRIMPGGCLLSIERYDDRLEYSRGATNYIATLEQSA